MVKVLLFCLLNACLLVGLHSAAVETVVEEHKDSGNVAAAPLPVNINEDCHQPRETGRCFALFYRYAFNVEKQQCEEFIYGGCAGNSNNFETLADCERKCLRIFEQPETTTDAVAAADATDAAMTVVPNEEPASKYDSKVASEMTEISTAAEKLKESSITEKPADA